MPVHLTNCVLVILIQISSEFDAFETCCLHSPVTPRYLSYKGWVILYMLVPLRSLKQNVLHTYYADVTLYYRSVVSSNTF